ncbi:MAG: DUF2797 domain-containing protein [Bacteroidales bacterium]|nr:DUF2797 domain-containing protein [Bacteroidales bacterium]HOY38408.1 DUF2797 domain-containing protein [Bacteroidales bacterium]HQP05121.1 DUF2797 domain-containing protein [Bacteroidales bacterium]
MEKVFSGTLRKLQTRFDNPVRYSIYNELHDTRVNPLIGRSIRISHNGVINCIHCGAETKQSFHNGYCYSCFITLAETDAGVLHPELDKSHLGISRDMEWSKANSLIDHYVYLAVTGNLKVGVTRHTQIPTRWIDQGAISAVKLAKTPYRQLAGQIEVELKKYVSDKTNVAAMLQAVTHSIDLVAQKNLLSEHLPEELQQYVTLDNRITQIIYPIHGEVAYKTNLKLANTPQFEAKLIGVKGQYLIFTGGIVFNVRNHSGYHICIELE